jgi:replicative DNA helicase
MSDFLLPAPVEPHNREAEENLLGSILVRPEGYYDIVHFLNAGDFYIHRNGWIWEAFGDLVKRNSPIDALTVSEELERKGRLAEAGGAAYIAELMNDVPYSLNVAAYGHIVEENAIRRRMLGVASDMAVLAHDVRTSIMDSVQQVSANFNIIAPSRITEKNISEQISDLWEEVETRMKDPKDVWGFPTGLKDIDIFLGGLQREEFTVVSGEPGIGKSTFCDQAAINVARCGFNVVIYSWEMPAKQILRRLINLESGIKAHAMKSGRITEAQFNDGFIPSANAISLLPLTILDDASMSMQQLRCDIMARRRAGKLDLAIIDYIGLIVDSEPDRNEKELKQSTELKRLTRSEGIHIVGIHTQPKEGVKEKIPGTSHLSGPIQNVNNADNLIYLVEHIPDEKGEKPNPQLITALFAKSREEGKKRIHLVKKLDKPGFGDLVKAAPVYYPAMSRTGRMEPTEKEIPF